MTALHFLASLWVTSAISFILGRLWCRRSFQKSPDKMPYAADAARMVCVATAEREAQHWRDLAQRCTGAERRIRWFQAEAAQTVADAIRTRVVAGDALQEFAACAQVARTFLEDPEACAGDQVVQIGEASRVRLACNQARLGVAHSIEMRFTGLRREG